MRHAVIAILGSCLAMLGPASADEIVYDDPVPEIDAYVDACMDRDGVGFLPGTDVICYNAAIFPEQYLKLNELEPASRIVITSPGGNVVTARGMTKILEDRNEPVTIAGPCMSACAMVILPALDDVHIHRTSLIAVHGIVMMPFERWFPWQNDGREPNLLEIIQAQNGLNMDFAMHSSLGGQMRGHLRAQDIDLDYIMVISDAMEEDARSFENCRIDPDQYWGIITPEHLKTYMGDAVTRMEDFVSEWDDPENAPYKAWGHPISAHTFMLRNYYADHDCSADEN